MAQTLLKIKKTDLLKDIKKLQALKTIGDVAVLESSDKKTLVVIQLV